MAAEWVAVLWTVSTVLVILLVWAVVSLSRSPLNEHRRLPWVLTIFILPGVGSAIWLWWRYWYYPRRSAEEPDWDPNGRAVTVNAPRRPGQSGGVRTSSGAQESAEPGEPG